MVAQMLQTMEIAWLRMQLGEFSEHPLNRGWMNVFRRWTNSEIVNRHWAALRGQFSQDFVQFCKNELKLVVYDIFPGRLSDACLAHFQSPDPETDAKCRPTVQALESLIDEFEFEWYQESERDAGIEHYLRDVAKDSSGEPLAWIIWVLPAGADDETRYAGGIVTVREPRNRRWIKRLTQLKRLLAIPALWTAAGKSVSAQEVKDWLDEFLTARQLAEYWSESKDQDDTIERNQALLDNAVKQIQIWDKDIELLCRRWQGGTQHGTVKSDGIEQDALIAVLKRLSREAKHLAEIAPKPAHGKEPSRRAGMKLGHSTNPSATRPPGPTICLA